ncbi:hypothetical protein PENTCL1PPCAC_5379, partial [Pristionchus entomophagus]
TSVLSERIQSQDSLVCERIVALSSRHINFSINNSHCRKLALLGSSSLDLSPHARLRIEYLEPSTHEASTHASIFILISPHEDD